MITSQQNRPHIVSPNTRQILSRENSLSPLPQQQLHWHTPQINTTMNNKQSFVLNNTNVCGSNDESFKIILPPTTSKSSITPPSTGTR